MSSGCFFNLRIHFFELTYIPGPSKSALSLQQLTLYNSSVYLFLFEDIYDLFKQLLGTIELIVKYFFYSYEQFDDRDQILLHEFGVHLFSKFQQPCAIFFKGLKLLYSKKSFG